MRRLLTLLLVLLVLPAVGVSGNTEQDAPARWRARLRHSLSPRSAPMPKVLKAAWPCCSTFSVFLPRRMSMMCPVPKLMPLAWFTR